MVKMTVGSTSQTSSLSAGDFGQICSLPEPQLVHPSSGRHDAYAQLPGGA